MVPIGPPQSLSIGGHHLFALQKADKRALEGKVSRMQFDSMTEQLNNMLQELLSKISGQEKDWNKVIEKISSEMDCKVREGWTETVILVQYFLKVI